MQKLKIAGLRIGVFAGGVSSEREVSLRSGRAVLEALSRSGITAVSIDPTNPLKTKKELQKIDLAFLALHGKGGEDGTIQKTLEKTNIPYVGSDAKGSWLAFNKVEAKRIFERSKIPTPLWTTVTKKNWRKLETFPVPFFVKPVADGSSIGVFLVEDFKQSVEKLKQGLSEHGALLVEKRIQGREFTVGILGKKPLPVVELRPKKKFYDYEAKYTSGMTEYLVPAPIPESWRRRFQRCALDVHEALGLRDFSRVDLVTDREGEPFVLEANTIPGFTELSLLPKAAREAGISFEALCLKLIEMAWKRGGSNGKA